MYLIAGLGNPGKKYEKTRHNIGFMAVDKLAKTDSEFSGWKKEKKLKTEAGRATIAGKSVLLLKPQTFMNLSGDAVRAAMRCYKIPIGNVWVIHDDLDFPIGTMRLKIGGSAAGHKGVVSVIDAIGANFGRIRIGIQPAQISALSAEDFVVAPFTTREMKIIKETLDRCSDAISKLLAKGIEAAMTEFNKK